MSIIRTFRLLRSTPMRLFLAVLLCGLAWSLFSVVSTVSADAPAPRLPDTPLDAGGLNACVVKSDSSIACWGNETYGPGNPPEPNTGFAQVSSSFYHACAVKVDGSIVCWGENDSGQATPPEPNSGFVQVSTGVYHTCALKHDGSLACWGSPADGNTTLPSPNNGFTQVSLGSFHSCALKDNGSVTCWGRGDDGRTTPPTTNSAFKQVSAGGAHTCALKVDGSVACWGSAAKGQTTPPTTNSDFKQISSGDQHVCAVKADGSLACWGDNEYNKATPPTPNSGFVGVSAGDSHTCALKDNGSVTCWGDSSDGRTSPPALTARRAMVASGWVRTCVLRSDGIIACYSDNGYNQNVVPLPNSGFTQVNAGEIHACALRSNGSAACWGNNQYGESSPPMPNTRFVQVSAGFIHSCGVKSDGSIACWGEPSLGGTNPPANNGFVQVSAGIYHSCAVRVDGSIYCWGQFSAQPSPNSGFVQVSAGTNSNCGLKSNGSVVCWGNIYGPVPSPNSGFTQVDTMYTHTCGLKNDGTTLCWGETQQPPEINKGLTQISTGYRFTCALTGDSAVTCWGPTTPYYHAPGVALNPPALAGGSYGANYNQTLSVQYYPPVTPPYTYDVYLGTLPPGLTLSSTGQLTGTPTQAGSFTFTLRGLEASRIMVTRQYTVVVAKVPLTVKANDKIRAYGDLNPAFTSTFTGLVNGDTFAVSYTSAAVTDPVGSYPIVPTPVDSTPPKLSNYIVTPVNGTLTVDPALLTIEADDKSRAYGEPNPTFTASFPGLKNNDPITATFTTPAGTTSPVGDYIIVPAAAGLPAVLGNYTITPMNGTLTVDPASLTITANDDSREYGEPNPTLSGEISGIKNNEAISATYSTSAGLTSPVGDYDISPAVVAAPGVLANYIVDPVNGTLTVDPAPLTIEANDDTREYGEPNPTFDGTVSGHKNSDVITAGYTTSADLTSPVGDYAIVPAMVGAPETLKNYTLVPLNGTLTVEPAPLSITANNATRLYGDLDPDFSATFLGLKNGDTITASFTTNAAIDSPVAGSYTITPAAVDSTPSTLGNYTVTLHNGTLSIERALLTVRAKDLSKPHGTDNPLLEYIIEGFKNSEDETVITGTPSLDTTVVKLTRPGTYPILITGGLDADNYEFEYVDGTFTVTGIIYFYPSIYKN